MGDDTRSFRFITLLNQTTQPDHHHHDQPFPDLELDEADMFYSSSSSTAMIGSSYGYHYGTLPSVDHDHYDLTLRNFGLSALLVDDDDEHEDAIATAPQPVLWVGHQVNGTGPHQSAPQAVPTWRSRTGYSWGSEERRDVEDDEEAFSQESEIVPPHVMVARSQTSSAFSVLEGAGRTLKGRDLRRVRNAVWQKTGFLDL